VIPEKLDSPSGADPIAIVGLGPVGVSLAGLLARRGHRIIGFDREVDVFPLPRAAHIDHTGLRTLQEIGVLDRLLSDMIPNPGVAFLTANDQVLEEIPGNQPSPSGLPASMYFHQPNFDRTLRDTVAAMPNVAFHTATHVVELNQGDDGVEVSTRSADGVEARRRAAYVCACDGASGLVRGWLGVELEDLNFHEKWIVVDLKLSREVPTLPGRAVTYADPARPLGIVPMPGIRCRFELMLMPGEDPTDMQRDDVIKGLVERWVPRDAAEIERVAVYGFDGVVAERWRVGRVLLAGDAAHRMPPFLGQGMNTGVRDAVNLAWKLDLVARGKAPIALLDTYEEERKPNVRSVVASAVRIGRVVCELDPAVAKVRDDAFLSGRRDARAELYFKLPRYEPGTLILEGGGGLAVQPIANGRRFDDVVGPRFLVLARNPVAIGGSATFWTDEIGALIATPDDFPDFKDELEAWLDRADAEVIVVRPDRYVLAVGEGLDAITSAVRGGPLAAAAEAL
jgi:3-(3-hydroxy-phenyl)propionate hydroxylase